MRRFAACAAMAAIVGMSTGCGISQQQEVQVGAQQAQQVNAQLPIVQDPADAEAHVMPTAAMRSTAADAVLPLQEIPKFLSGLCMEVGQRVG